LFSSAILPPWARQTPKITEVLPLLYLHGLSSGDFVPVLGQFLGSRSIVARLSPGRSPGGTGRDLSTARPDACHLIEAVARSDPGLSMAAEQVVMPRPECSWPGSRRDRSVRLRA